MITITIAEQNRTENLREAARKCLYCEVYLRLQEVIVVLCAIAMSYYERSGILCGAL